MMIAEKIWKSMEPRWIEMWKKISKGNTNKATPLAYQIGFMNDISEVLKQYSVKPVNKRLSGALVLAFFGTLMFGIGMESLGVTSLGMSSSRWYVAFFMGGVLECIAVWYFLRGKNK